MAQEFYVDGAGEHRWRVQASNNRTLGDSGEGYHNELDAAHGLLTLVQSVDVAALKAHIAKLQKEADSPID